MALVPRSLLTLGAGVLSARASAGLKRRGAQTRAQERVFKNLISKLSAASAWASAGIEDGMSYEEFRSRVPIQSHAELAPAIARMMRGEQDVLWPGTCQIYCTTAGGSGGSPKHVPVTEPMLRHFKQCSLDSLLWYSARVGHAGVFKGRHLMLGGSTTMSPIAESEPFEAYTGGISGIAALNIPKWVERHFYEPGAEVAAMTDWPAKLAAIAHRCAGVDITLLSGMPAWVLGLAAALRERSVRGKARAQHLQGIWPNFECFVHGGGAIIPYQEELRGLLGPSVNFHEVYPSAEAFVAAQDAESAAGLRLMADAGVFYEFVPMSDFDERRLTLIGDKAVPLSGVEAGVDYALILTTPAGLARYACGDVVRFVSTEPARLVPVGGTSQQLAAFGERVSERHVSETLAAVCRRNGWTIVNFHVAPMNGGSTISRGRGRHEWWVELKPGTITTPTGPIMAVELDQELRKISSDYDSRRASGGLDAPYVRLVMPGVFEHWMRHHGRWGGHNKVARCRSDRLIADELADALQFAKD